MKPKKRIEWLEFHKNRLLKEAESEDKKLLINNHYDKLIALQMNRQKELSSRRYLRKKLERANA